MQESQEAQSQVPKPPELEVTNPIQAASEIFYKPTAVFDAIAVKDNWSWIPFLLVVITAAIPAYLYFNIVDFDWYKNAVALAQNPEGSPAEIEAFANYMELGSTQIITALSVAIGFPIIMAILAGYFTLCTRNDEKSVHGYTDWYGAMWWMSMPTVINSLLACIVLAMQDPGAQISQAVLAPLSVAFVIGAEIGDKWINLLTGIAIHSFWGIFLGMVCLRSWTNFSQSKALIIAIIPSLLLWGLTIAFTI
ncbi:YIP1 family protein [Ningiella sp. W23]|uniref:YIP1 family protein n=1 Tax=Ningiella sp. W23 TaxID=3023715 RepID=UPI0037572D17